MGLQLRLQSLALYKNKNPGIIPGFLLVQIMQYNKDGRQCVQWMKKLHRRPLQICGSKAIQIRTVFVADSYLHFRESDGFRALLVVEGDHHFIIVQENRVDEGVDEHLAMALLPHVQLAEAVEPEGHKLRADLGLRQLFAGKPVLKLVAAVFQLLQPLLCGASQDALLNGVEKIDDGGFRFTKLLLVKRHVHVVTLLQVHQHGDYGFNGFVVHHHFHRFVDN